MVMKKSPKKTNNNNNISYFSKWKFLKLKECKTEAWSPTFEPHCMCMLNSPTACNAD